MLHTGMTCEISRKGRVTFLLSAKRKQSAQTHREVVSLLHVRFILTDPNLRSPADFGLWYQVIWYGNPETQMHWIILKQRGWRTRPTANTTIQSPRATHRCCWMRCDNNYRRESSRMNRAWQPDKAIRNYWSTSNKRQDERLVEVNTTNATFKFA